MSSFEYPSIHTELESPYPAYAEEGHSLQACAVDTAQNELPCGYTVEESDQIIQACRDIWIDEVSGQLDYGRDDSKSTEYAECQDVRISPRLDHRGPGSFHEFIQRIVYLFEQQRSFRQYQFAVLFLSPLPIQNINSRNMLFRTQNGVVSKPGEATNSTNLTFPPDDALCNYMTARPERHRHAEVKLMDNFETLLSIYNSLSMPRCRSIVLYTWLFPCSQCAEYIIKNLQDYIIEGAYEVTVIYTSKQKDLKDEEIAKILSRFELAGIEALYVSFDELLKRGSSLT